MSTQAITAASDELAICHDFGSLAADPLRCVRYSFPWGEADLADSSGPWKWQAEEFAALGAHLSNPATRYTPYRSAISSGHGIGKSAFVAQLIHWGLSTFDDCKIVITANTQKQLETKTQPEAAKWFRRAINRDWFIVQTQAIKVADDERRQTWRADFLPWSEKNPEAFAGAHNQRKRLIIIFDEASAIADSIWEVVEGALTDADTEIIWFAFGNPTKSSGCFYEACFGNQRHRWHHRKIDAREVEGTNKQQLADWIQDYGIDSDFVRVRVLGEPPRAGDAQFIDRGTIEKAQEVAARSLPDDPVIVGVDLAWGGADDNVIRFRKGMDARSIPPIRIKGEFTRDPMVLINRLGDVLRTDYNGERVAMMFIDSAGIAGQVGHRLKQLGFKNVQEVNFGADSPESSKTRFFRDYMWQRMKDFLFEGGAIDKDTELAADLAGPTLLPDRKQRVWLESKEAMKKRGVDSPDDGDALALTFAYPVGPKKQETSPKLTGPHGGRHGWML